MRKHLSTCYGISKNMEMAIEQEAGIRQASHTSTQLCALLDVTYIYARVTIISAVRDVNIWRGCHVSVVHLYAVHNDKYR